MARQDILSCHFFNKNDIMKYTHALIALSALAICSSCSSESEDLAASMQTAQSMRSPKIIGVPEQTSSPSILVKFNTAPTNQQLETLLGTDIQAAERLFKSTPGKEELEATYGLDCWYQVTIADAKNLEDAAEYLAAFEDVKVVEFDADYKRVESNVCIPVTAEQLAQSVHGVSRAGAELQFNDPLLVDQWHYINRGDVSVSPNVSKGADINVKDVWSTLTCGDPSIIVAVVDEGVKHTHPDLNANMWVNEAEKSGKPGVDDDNNGYVDDIHGFNFVSEGEITWDKELDSGHGTHVAGTIAAVNNNNTGVAGVAGGSGKGDGVKIMSCQIFDNKRGGSVSVSVNAIKYAADNGASIISCSFGYPGGTFKSDGAYAKQCQAEIDVIRYFEASKNNDVLDGNIAIFASGNDGDPYATYPGALNDIISVSSFGPDHLPTYYTNYGPGCNIVAPGGEYYASPYNIKGMVLSTYPSEFGEGDYAYMQGTSMACPHVSGVAALGLAYAKKIGKTFTRTEFKELLLSSANDIDTRLNGTKYSGNKTIDLYPYRKMLGTGSIDAYLFCMQIEGIPCLQAENGKKQWLDVGAYFGTSAVNLTYLDVSISDEDYQSLGLAEKPYMQYGRLYIHPTKLGSGKIKITAVAGGSTVGGEDAIGGMVMTQEVSVISRSFKSKNGGWL